MSTGAEVEQSDVEEITHMIEVITEKAEQIRIKAFSLRDLAKPDEIAGKIVPSGDFASETKRRLGCIQHTLNEVAESLGRFAG